jgi:DNA-binding MarR family transcriptional regulator
MGEKLKQWLKQSKFESLDQETALNIFVTAYFLRSKHEEIMVKYGLTMPQYNVLRILKGVYPDGHPRCEIISRMIEPAPDVTRIIDRLMKDNLVERFNSDKDKRLSMTRITEKGTKLLERANPEVEALGTYISSTLNNSEKKELSSLLEKIYGDSINLK